jgi:hypothetical protein
MKGAGVPVTLTLFSTTCADATEIVVIGASNSRPISLDTENLDSVVFICYLPLKHARVIKLGPQLSARSFFVSDFVREIRTDVLISRPLAEYLII